MKNTETMNVPKLLPNVDAMRLMPIAVLMLTFTVTTIQDASAQNRRDRRAGLRQYFSNGMMSLFRLADVQAELDLTRVEAELIFALQADLFSEYRNARRDNRTDSGLPTPEQVTSESKAVAERLLATILHPSKYKRLQELWLQRQGLVAIATDSLADALQLDEAQRSKTRELVQQLSSDYPRGKISDADAEIAKQITETLNPDQQEAWERMLGRPFSFR